MHILYLGDNNVNSTSFHRSQALARLGHTVSILNPYSEFSNQLFNPFLSKINYLTGYVFLEKRILKWLKLNIIIDSKYDIIWVNSGELFGAGSLKYLKLLNIPIVLYNNDDPTGSRDGNRFCSLIKALPFYDLCVVVRFQNVEEFYEKGAKNVMRVKMSYDEIIHNPNNEQVDILCKFKSDVAFIGTWMRFEKRDEFILNLINSGISVSVWGDRWEKSKYWYKIKPFYKGNSLAGKDYVAAIKGAKVCIGMLSKGNRDQHTTRSFEIPFAGGLLCGERTIEHLEMFKEGEEALFWSDSNECIRICKKFLSDDILREKIRINGMEKVRKLKVGNENVCQTILNRIIRL
jgi:spore maturation protein CgeB